MSGFDEVFEEAYGYCIDDNCKHRYSNSKELAWMIWQEQQKKIDELERKLQDSDKEKRKYFTQVLNRQDQIKDLQNQVDSAIKYLDKIDDCLKTYNSEKAKRILKGEKDD